MSDQTKTKQLPKREEIPVERTWDVEAIFSTDEAWEKEFNELKSEMPKIQEFKGKLEISSDQLYQCLKYQNELSMRLGKLYVYAHLKSDSDTTNSFYQGLNDRASNLATQFSNYSSFIIPELLSIPEEKIAQFVAENDDLKIYKHALDETNRQRPHVLSESEEAILAQVSEVTASSSNTFGMLNNADLKFPTIKDENGEEIEVTHGRFIRFMESSDRRVREDAFKAIYETYEKYKNTLASTLSGNVKKNLFNANVRNYQSARQAALDNNNIPEVVYDQLVDTVNDHLHLLHRYVALRKKALDLDEIHMYDLYTPIIKDVKMEVTYEEAKDLVIKGVEPLGEEYVNIIKEGFEKRWVDIEENVGKRSGAYSSGTYGTMPYILMNWQNNINNLFTLTHEFGHSVHSYYSRKTQPYHYSGYSIFVAEVASTCNEALLNDYLLKVTEDKKKKLYLLNHFLEGFRGTVFRQTMFAEFEKLIHEKAGNGEPLTPELLSKTYYELNKKYFGDNIILDDEIAMEWARIPHFYYNFYVYQYATGYSAATALSKQILEEGNSAVTRYIDFLKAGSSDYPIEILKRAGVDMTSSNPIKEALTVFEKTLNEMEQLLFDK
ncbi:oligoendopeptidase F [Anaerobacillus alkalidiazotrophicus]|uniref:Oligopeptidase F n=1 Tax=Anaerobacillus alkalidiazotrophicus TaxID=472963 RepID=A0A1S2M5N5_9BACI|nr:oligoendopeptidase F [Anaerobacillus alkalidiazotrophicus]OIJ18502.1 oligoendopeptidase F [Anaerobacillus alkalidiazotrophicus]OIJ19981.1 oligoendopeptidase F [Anaerobacillus alkalidiazotrophicus]